MNIFVSDIFGKTEALEALASGVASNYLILDPYEGQDMKFESERNAYQYFSENVGLQAYSEKLEQCMAEIDTSVNLIGFSVGASAIWKVSNRLSLPSVNHAICFYGSQIRHHRRVKPLFPVSLIFPHQEQHFSVPELVDELSSVHNVEIKEVPYLHGFMNKLSDNFNQTGYESGLEMLSVELD
ncbi:hypothetical protein EYS00_07425 [Alteromonas sp. KUL49]|nr:hypothetical protein EYS00_07425 [Alteromonas sp. KUL49]